MEKLHGIFVQIQKEFPQEFKNIISCRKSNNHDWTISAPPEQADIRLVDIECKNCGINFTIAMKFFVGIQDHG
jgi:hypothetical protein